MPGQLPCDDVSDIYFHMNHGHGSIWTKVILKITHNFLTSIFSWDLLVICLFAFCCISTIATLLLSWLLFQLQLLAAVFSLIPEAAVGILSLQTAVAAEVGFLGVWDVAAGFGVTLHFVTLLITSSCPPPLLMTSATSRNLHKNDDQTEWWHKIPKKGNEYPFLWP